jgi:hypothetical protein
VLRRPIEITALIRTWPAVWWGRFLLRSRYNANHHRYAARFELCVAVVLFIPSDLVFSVTAHNG